MRTIKSITIFPALCKTKKLTTLIVGVLLFILATECFSLSGKLNLNRANEEELQRLPYIGCERARAIVEYRNTQNGFKSIDELLQAVNIGKATFEAIKPYLKLDGSSSLDESSSGILTEQVQETITKCSSFQNETIRIVPTQPGDIRILADEAYFHIVSDYIRQARNRIDIAMFLFKTTKSPKNRSATIVNELISAKNRGVAVNVLLEHSNFDDDLNKENEKTGRRLKSNGIQVRFDTIATTSHAKIIVIDDRYCFVGSHNLTHSALRHNNELTLLVDSSELASQLLQYTRSL